MLIKPTRDTSHGLLERHPGDLEHAGSHSGMITSISNVDELVEMLEVRFLANRDENLRFGLLTDFRDAAAEAMPEDAALLEHASGRIGH